MGLDAAAVVFGRGHGPGEAVVTEVGPRPHPGRGGQGLRRPVPGGDGTPEHELSGLQPLSAPNNVCLDRGPAVLSRPSTRRTPSTGLTHWRARRLPPGSAASWARPSLASSSRFGLSHPRPGRQGCHRGMPVHSLLLKLASPDGLLGETRCDFGAAYRGWRCSFLFLPTGRTGTTGSTAACGTWNGLTPGQNLGTYDFMHVYPEHLFAKFIVTLFSGAPRYRYTPFRYKTLPPLKSGGEICKNKYFGPKLCSVLPQVSDVRAWSKLACDGRRLPRGIRQNVTLPGALLAHPV